MTENNVVDNAKVALEQGIAEAQSILNDPAKVEDVLAQAKERVAGLPGAVGGALANIPLMANMIKCYVTREYTEVSPKVVASVLGALVYLVKGKDLIPDSIPVVGLVDDVAVIALAMKLNEPELNAFTAWQETHVILRDESAASNASASTGESDADFAAPNPSEIPTA